MDKKKGYFWKPDSDADCGLGVVALSVDEAKKLGHDYWGFEYGHDETDSWIQQRCNLVKDANVDDLPIGVVEAGDKGLKAGLYGYVEESDCPVCKVESITIYADNGIVGCNDCIEKEGEKLNIKSEDGK